MERDRNMIKKLLHKLKAHHKIPVRHGVSQHVLEIAKRLKEEYQTDLDYLQEH